MRALLPIIASAFALTVQASESLIEGGRSKNGRYEVRIIQDSGHSGTSDYSFAVYDTRSKGCIAQFHDVGGHHRYEQARQESKALWNDSSSFVALTDSDSRHTRCIYIFHVSDTSSNRLVVPDFVQNALGRVDATEIDLHCHPNPVRWNGQQLHVVLDFAVAHPARGRVHYECEALLECANLDSIARLRSVTNPKDIEAK